MKHLSARQQYRSAFVKHVKRGQKQRFSLEPGGQQFAVIEGQHTRIATVAAATQITPGYMTIKEVARRYASFVSGTDLEAAVIAIQECSALIESVKSGAVRAMHRIQLTPVHADARGMTEDTYLAECRLSLDAARRYLMEHGALSEDAVQRILPDPLPENEPTTGQAAAEVEPEPDALAAERAGEQADTTGLVAWQVAALELWPTIINEKGRRCSARNAMRWLKNNGPRDVFGGDQPDQYVMRWIGIEGSVHTLTYRAFSNQLARWRKAGRIPKQK